MPYRAKVMICHSKFTCLEGAMLAACPPSLLRQFINDDVVEMVGDPDQPEPGFEDAFADMLSEMDRNGLKNVIRWNNLQKLVPVMTSWSDEQIRTTIRQVVQDLGDLVIVDPSPSVPVVPPVETVT